MKAFLRTKVGVISVFAFVAMMAVVFHRVSSRRGLPAPGAPASAPLGARPRPSENARLTPSPPSPIISTPDPAELTENAAYLDRYFELDQRTRTEHDRQGNKVTRRQTAATPHDAGHTTAGDEAAPTAPPLTRTTLRLQGRPAPAWPAAVLTPAPPQPPRNPASGAEDTGGPATAGLPREAAAGSVPRVRPKRFNPYGRVIKCELVFTIDSTNEQTPLVASVMEPVYNNGALVIPAGAELHGTTRPDRLRDRIFSGTDWILVFPREPDRINGRQLNVKGVALNRVEPDVNGMTWGITDGSYGLEGAVIRTLQQEEIKRFAATFLASAAMALQERQTDRSGQQSARNTPQNAVLQGLSANFARIVDEISAEIEQHGVFIRVPAGHQFYFYPMQIIDPDAADVSSDIASVR